MRIIYRDAELNAVGRTEALAGEAFTGEAGGHKFVICCRRGGQAEALTGSVYGVFIAPNGDGIALTQAGIDGDGRAWVILDAACYQQRGSFGIRVFHAAADETEAVTAIWSGAGYMSVGEPETIYDPGDVINLAAIEAKIAEMDAATEACEEAAATAQQAASFVNSIIAPTYSTGTSYSVGDYCTYEGSMYRCVAATGGSFEPSDWEQVLVGGEFKRMDASLVGRVLSDEIKLALLACFQSAAWATPDGQDYFDALNAALNPPANLMSISAAYTQTMTVYTTDQLSVLRPDLVVTANYSDGTSSRIYAYLLSGSLTEGASAITVTYGGKSATFSVNVTDATLLYELPQETTFTGDVSEIINTGVCVMPENRDMTMLIDFTYSSAVSWGAYMFYAGQLSGAYNAFAVRIYTDTGAVSVETHSSGSSAYAMTNISADERARLVIRYDAATSSISCFQYTAADGIQTGSSSNTGVIASGVNLLIGGINSSFSRYKGKITTFRVYTRKLTDNEVYAFLDGGV